MSPVKQGVDVIRRNREDVSSEYRRYVAFGVREISLSFSRDPREQRVVVSDGSVGSPRYEALLRHVTSTAETVVDGHTSRRLPVSVSGRTLLSSDPRDRTETRPQVL